MKTFKLTNLTNSQLKTRSLAKIKGGGVPSCQCVCQQSQDNACDNACDDTNGTASNHDPVGDD